MQDVIAEQVAHFEKKIEELEDRRQHYVARLSGAVTADRTCYLYIDAFNRELRECRRSLAQLTGNES